jgi:hypothetical protein
MIGPDILVGDPIKIGKICFTFMMSDEVQRRMIDLLAGMADREITLGTTSWCGSA